MKPRPIAHNRRTIAMLLSIAVVAIGVTRSVAAETPAETSGRGGSNPPAAKSKSPAGGEGEVTTNDTLGTRLRQSRHGEVIVVQVRHNGPGDRRGIRPGDQILSIDSAHIASVADVNRALREHDRAQDLKIVVKPSTQPRYITLASLHRQSAASKPAHPGMLGVTLNVEDQRVIVSELYSNGPAEEAGVKTGDVIEAIDGHAVATRKDALDILGRHKAGDAVDLLIERNGWRRDFQIALAPQADVANRPLVTETPETTIRGQGPVVERATDDDEWLDSDEYEDIRDPFLRARETDFDG
jgi:S1-C subfamily serine protease